MIDKYGRNINYMRISITDRCNLRCRYCMPKDIELTQMDELLSYEEIVKVCEQAVRLGITRLKLTGGEPLVRKNVDRLIAMMKEIPGVEQVTLTTNGILLKDYAVSLKAAGLDAVNVSLDTLDKVKFGEITGFDALEKVKEGIDAALQADLPLKVNCVLTKNNTGYESLIHYAESKKIKIRFIEIMPIGYGKEEKGISNRWLMEQLTANYGKPESIGEEYGNGPAVYYRFPGKDVLIGFISAIHGKFCDSCNRIRMTAQGELKSCLCFEHVISVKDDLRAENMEQVRAKLAEVIEQKPYAHCFEEITKVTEVRKMNQIGG